jgi:RNA polymerase sigma factor (sigma-70 family)
MSALGEVMVATITYRQELISREADFLAAAKAGDGEAFGKLVKPHIKTMYSVAMRWTSSRAIAEEAVQESLTAAFSQLEAFKPIASFRAYLLGITMKKAATAARSERRLRHREERSWTADAEGNGEAQLQAMETAQALKEALSKMPEKRRRAAVLRLDSQLSYKEIAQALSTSERSARVLVHLAVKDLKTLLASQAGEGEMI